jgi:hypothetical protein
MLYESTVVQFTALLNNLSAMLDKAEVYATKKDFDVDVLLHSRLAPDQYDLMRQVQIVCDVAKIGVARLTDTVDSTPVHEDNETSVAELQQRINDVITHMNTFSSNDLIDLDKANVTFERWEGKYLSGQEYLIQCTIPNLYFHISTAFAILRHNGVMLGKDDFLGEMPYKT